MIAQSPNWFATASFSEIVQYSGVFNTHSLLPHHLNLIAFNAFLNPDPAVFEFWSTQHFQSISSKGFDVGYWSYAILNASQNHRAHFLSMIEKMDYGLQKEILYGAVGMKDHGLTHDLLKFLGNNISPAHLIRHAVVNKNKKGAMTLMRQHPHAIPEAHNLIMHNSYKYIHTYWDKLHAAYQKQTLIQALGPNTPSKIHKISKI